MFDANVSMSETRCYIAARIKVLCLKWQKSRGHLVSWSAKAFYAPIQQMSCTRLEILRWSCQISLLSISCLRFFFSRHATKCNIPFLHRSADECVFKKLFYPDFVLKRQCSCLWFLRYCLRESSSTMPRCLIKLVLSSITHKTGCRFTARKMLLTWGLIANTAEAWGPA